MVGLKENTAERRQRKGGEVGMNREVGWSEWASERGSSQGGGQRTRL